jgi:hypothetical protein
MPRARDSGDPKQPRIIGHLDAAFKALEEPKRDPAQGGTQCYSVPPSNLPSPESIKSNPWDSSFVHFSAYRTISNKSCGDPYARLFAASADMAELLETVPAQQVDEFDRQVKDAQQAVPMTGVTRCGPDKIYTILPDWVQNGLRLLAEMKG